MPPLLLLPLYFLDPEEYFLFPDLLRLLLAYLEDPDDPPRFQRLELPLEALLPPARLRLRQPPPPLLLLAELDEPPFFQRLRQLLPEEPL